MKKKLLPGRRPFLPYPDFISAVRGFDWRGSSEADLKAALAEPFEAAKVCSLLSEVIARHTGLRVFDTQLAAAYSLQEGRIAELPTGEGKTLAAVMAAACLGLQGRSVHVLTFNDYLAERDWNIGTPVLNFCGLSTACIRAESKPMQRKSAYRRDIVYLTAKEAGFDFLKNFLCTEEEQLLDPALDAAIVDEADSILLDEARIPLVLAGERPGCSAGIVEASRLAESLTADELEIREQQFWLTENGCQRLELQLGIENLYGEKQEVLLAELYAAIEAHHLLKRDRDYIVKGKTVYLIEDTTGRIAPSRKFPELLQRAVEQKEGIASGSQTSIYNSIPLQFFLLQYKSLCGMSGTARSAEKELASMYSLKVDCIPPHRPCIRKDQEDWLFPSEAEKKQAVIREVQKCYEKGQPVLLGTQSVEETMEYAALLTKAQIPCFVLNAAKDEQEAELIASAGKPYRVTVSTNMAGRGVDIRLGGENGADRAFVEAAGGLYVMGCCMNRSLRIDHQLRGRAGRQGDPGESRFFFSAEEVLSAFCLADGKQRPALTAKLIRQIQRIEQGKDAEARYMLEKYAFILEQQRQQITEYRGAVLSGEKAPGFTRDKERRLYERLVEKAGEEGVKKAEQQLTLYFINLRWADYLAEMEAIRDGIHLVILGGENPIEEYNKRAVFAFSEMEKEICRDVIQGMKTCDITKDGIDMRREGLAGATATYSYLIDESKSQFSRLPDVLRQIFRT